MGWLKKQIMRMRLRGCLCERGQMAVEMAVTLPAVLLVMVVAVDGLVFMGACASFDHAVPQAVLGRATAPSVSEVESQTREGAVLEELRAAFDSERESIEVSAASGYAGSVVYTATLRMVPWPLESSGRIFLGMRIPSLLEHSCSFAVMPVEVVS